MELFGKTGCPWMKSDWLINIVRAELVGANPFWLEPVGRATAASMSLSRQCGLGGVARSWVQAQSGGKLAAESDRLPPRLK